MQPLAERLFLTGKQMRMAQKQYAQNRKLENNRYRLEAERKFDALLTEYVERKNSQLNLL